MQTHAVADGRRLDADGPAAALSRAQWERLATKRIYFGHQSVGGNIVDGIAELIAESPTASLRLVEGTPRDLAGPAFVHAFIGRNGDPRSKTAAFAEALHAAAGGGAGAIALHKYCYVDVDRSTDVDGLFADYRRSMAELRARQPRLTVVHVTMPLTATATTPRPVAVAKLVAKRILGRPASDERALNVRRNRFNALLRREYEGRDPIFDLARVESTDAREGRSYFVRGPERVYTLARQYTDDGGHLNALGRRRAAVELLSLLSTL